MKKSSLSPFSKKIIFVYPAVKLKGRYRDVAKGIGAPPQGLCYLAAIARDMGYSVEIIDAHALGLDEEQLAGTILERAPDYVGFTAPTMLVGNAGRTAELVKSKNSGITVIIGGPHLTAMPEETMDRFKAFDMGVVGEGERTISELLSAFEKGDSPGEIKGLVYRENGGIKLTPSRGFIENIDELPLPAWDLLPHLTRYYRQSIVRIDRMPSVSITTSRGCPSKCIFCARNVFGNTCRAYTAQKVMKIIDYLKKEYKIKGLSIEDENFLAYRKRLKNFCNLLIERKENLSWSCAGRVDMVSSEILKLMKKAGCWEISFGIESGSQPILDFIKKGITLEGIREAVSLTHDAGIKAGGYFIAGHPGETVNTLREKMQFARSIKLDSFQIAFMCPFPGTELYGLADEYGAFSRNWEDMNIWTPVFIPSGLSKEILVRETKKGYRLFYFRLSILRTYLKRALRPIYFKHYLREGLRIIKFFLKK
jgi:radical SAM superfamily enzyme YgiQ (UPF0313 family)